MTEALSYQFKLIKHLSVADVERVRDYLSHIIFEYPDLEKCPIDKALLTRAMAFVKREFTLNERALSPAHVFTRKHPKRAYI